MDLDGARGSLAIVGMSCRLPGGDGLEEYWKLLRTAGSELGPLPEERFNRRLFFDPRRGVPSKSYTDVGGVISSRPVDFSELPLPEELIEGRDVAHLILCEVAAQAVRDAGYDPLAMPQRNVGVYMGHTGGSPLVSDLAYSTIVGETSQYLFETPLFRGLGAQGKEIADEVVRRTRQVHPGRKPGEKFHLGALAASALISKAFDLSGPYMVVDAACASSLQAMAVGLRALQQGRVDMALVGGASYCKSDSLVLFSAAQSVSPTKSCPFGAAADGLISSEGYVVLAVKTLERAVADGDRIRAVIRGIGISSDGKGKSLWAPRKEGQQLAVRRAYAGGVDASRVQYIEAHATSTQVGDATELEGLADAMSELVGPRLTECKIPIGSTKGNVGHTLETAGMAGLVKVVLAMEHGLIPPAVGDGKLNKDVDWAALPFAVPFQEQPWEAPSDGGPRRGAVNAFGIGGLNVHVVLDEFQPTAATRALLAAPADAARARTADADDEGAVAIVGAGCIFPGAQTLSAFWDLLASGRQALRSAPAARWTSSLYLNDGRPETWKVASDVGGFIDDFVYDWKKHKIPPKQIAAANPLQFMLLEAADQALADAGMAGGKCDGSRTGVVVGTAFGGDFSNQLLMGLRLPEFEETLRGVLRDRGVAPEAIDETAEHFREALLRHMPALLDETGSFTSSTLASRITKAFNLMGGAFAMDAGACSAAFALQAAMDLLTLQTCDAVICAAGQRSMDVFEFESSSLLGRLSKDATHAVFDAAADGTILGEGCGVVVLKRLADARRDGNRIRGVIRGIGSARSDHIMSALEQATRSALAEARIPAAAVSMVEATGSGRAEIDCAEASALARALKAGGAERAVPIGAVGAQIGQSGGAAGMASLLKAATAIEHGTLPATLGYRSPNAALAEHGDALAMSGAATPLPAATAAGYRSALVVSVEDDMAHAVLLDNGVQPPAPRSQPAIANPASGAASSGSPWRIIRFAAVDGFGLREKIGQASANAAATFAADYSHAFAPSDGIRLAVTADSPETLAKRLRIAAEAVVSPLPPSKWEEQGVVLVNRPRPRRKAAAVFPGQGSQYPGMLRDLCELSSAARRQLEQVQDLLASRGWKGFDDFAWNEPERLGGDVWTTQAAMLAGDAIAWAAAKELGLRPDFVGGHSFGEFPALLAAGAWTIEEALLATRSRCDVVAAFADGDSAMLSVLADRETTAKLLDEAGGHVWMCAINSPQQCVVGGTREATEAFARRCAELRLTTRMLRVPCAFHTPLLNATRSPLAAALVERRIEPPRTPLISSVTGTFCSDPGALCENLVRQMTEPVQYLPMIERLYEQGARVFVEIGPSHVLTQLNRRILDGADDVYCTSLDHPQRSASEQFVRFQAFLEALDLAPVRVSARDAGSSTGRRPVKVSQPAAATNGSTASVETAATSASVRQPDARRAAGIVVFDATETRRAKHRSAGQHRAAPAGETPGRGANGTNGTNGTNGSHGAHTAGRPGNGHAGANGNGRNGSNGHEYRNGNGAGHVETGVTLKADDATAAVQQRLVLGVIQEHLSAGETAPSLDSTWRSAVGNPALVLEDLAELFELSRLDLCELSGCDTVREMADLLKGRPGKADWLQPKSRPSAPAPVMTEPRAIQSPSLASAGTDAGKLEEFLVQFVVEQTGYPAEIVELDADLEADLGIDSIKKAQLFGEIGERFAIAPEDGMSLDDFSTLRHVLDYLAAQSGLAGEVEPELALAGVSASPLAEAKHASPVALAPTAAPRRSQRATAPAASASGPSRPSEPPVALPTGDSYAEFLVNFVVEQTGYPAEIVELDADLEADLGIDSIKKAQLFGEIGQQFSLEAEDGLELDEFPTLAHVLAYLRQRRPAGGMPSGGGAANSAPPIAATQLASRDAAGGTASPRESAIESPEAEPACAATDGGDYEAFLVNFVVEQTGYPAEIVELDADLEADLGIDSIKKAQLFGEIGDHFALEAEEDVSFDDYPTLRHVRDYLIARLGGGAFVGSRPAGNVPATAGAPLNVEGSAAAEGVLPPAAIDSNEARSDATDEAYRRGLLQGRRHAGAIRGLLARMTATPSAGVGAAAATSGIAPTAESAAEIKGLAHGAGVLEESLLALNVRLGSSGLLPEGSQRVHADGSLELALVAQAGAPWIISERTSGGAARIELTLPGVIGALGGVNEHGIAASLRPGGGVSLAGVETQPPLAHALAELLRTSSTFDEAVRSARGLCGSPEAALIVSELASGRMCTVHSEQHGSATVSDAAEWRSVGFPALSAGATGPTLDAAGARMASFIRDLGTALRGGQAASWALLTTEGDRVVSAVSDEAALAEGRAAERIDSSLRICSAAANSALPASATANRRLAPVRGGVTQRFVLRAVDANATEASVPIVGPAWVVGDGPLGEALERELRQCVIAVERMSAAAASERLASLPAAQLPRSMVLTTASDAPLRAIASEADWKQRRAAGVAAPYWLCQQWLARLGNEKLVEGSALYAVTRLGGDFGLGGSLQSAEGGALAGLLKGVRHEYPELNVRVIDVDAADVSSLARRICEELQRSDREIEIGLSGDRRLAARPVEAAAPEDGPSCLPCGGAWVVSGGARGVTAAVAHELGRTCGARLHLLGTTAPESVDAEWLDASPDALARFRSGQMVAAKQRGDDPLKAWARIEKSIEIARTLRRMREDGIEARYHVCDIADRSQLAGVLEQVRRESGPIVGVIHGAGFEAAARFERKRPVQVERTIAAKNDGAAALMALTAGDPLQFFVGFGSTSGRLGGMGQTDYSLANDMLAKQVAQLRSERPGLRAATFHWHAWDEVGMAARPESRFALQAFGLKFMPLGEGIAHLMAELHAGLPEAEVLITEAKMCPDAIGGDAAGASADPSRAVSTDRAIGPLLNSMVQRDGDWRFTARLDPVRDVFLREHLRFGRPLLPAVAGLELLAEAARAASGGGQVRRMTDVAIEQGMVFSTDEPRDASIVARESAEGWRVEIASEFRNREGRLVEPARRHLTGNVHLEGPNTPLLAECGQPPFPLNKMIYPDDAAMYHGPALRKLESLLFQHDGGWGRLTAPPLAALAAPRDAAGWIVPSALLDGCFVACAIYSWMMCGQRIEIPSSFKEIDLFRPAREGEQTMVRFFIRSQDERYTTYDFVLMGDDGTPIAQCRGFRCVGLAKETAE